MRPSRPRFFHPNQLRQYPTPVQVMSAVSPASFITNGLSWLTSLSRGSSPRPEISCALNSLPCCVARDRPQRSQTKPATKLGNSQGRATPSSHRLLISHFDILPHVKSASRSHRPLINAPIAPCQGEPPCSNLLRVLQTGHYLWTLAQAAKTAGDGEPESRRALWRSTQGLRPPSGFR
ncbi:hypothetical protein BKA80DRAFT_79343 [Phyllosticta citrichinensis]